MGTGCEEILSKVCGGGPETSAAVTAPLLSVMKVMKVEPLSGVKTVADLA